MIVSVAKPAQGMSATGSLHQVRRYRPFIDGLRAVAILTVVGSHTNLPGFKGGFVGVDIFFVISGYLIINQIVEDIQGKRFSIFAFLARRTFRILPGFLLVLVVTLILATTVFVQPEHEDLAESFLLSTIMLANHHFLAHQGYFDMAAFTKPLLHMWSLGVEEQFYFLAPPILLLVNAASRAARKRSNEIWIYSTLAMGLISLVACVALTFPAGRPNISFYIMPTRGWEFILGGALPFLASTIEWFSPIAVTSVAAIGMAAIVISVIGLDPGVLYPSYYAALPATGAAMIILAGLLTPQNLVARCLAARLMVRIGLVSYAWYLWHWPLISFVQTIRFGQASLAEVVAAAALALGLAILTYRFVEFPIRLWRKNCPFRPRSIVAVGVASCLAVAVSGYVWSLRVAPLMQPRLLGLELTESTRTDYPAVVRRGVLLGDSHANAIANRLAAHAREVGSELTIITRAGCPPLLGVSVRDDRGRVAAFCDDFFRRITFQGDEFAIIVARWNYYLGLPASDPYYASWTLVDPAGGSDDFYQTMYRGLLAIISDAEHLGVQRILLLAPTPEFPWYAPYCAMRSLRIGADICVISRAKVLARRQKTVAILRQVAERRPNVRLLDPLNLFCGADNCRPNEGPLLYFSDLTHVSPAGAELLFTKGRRDFIWALTGKDD